MKAYNGLNHLWNILLALEHGYCCWGFECLPEPAMSISKNDSMESTQPVPTEGEHMTVLVCLYG